MRNVFKSKVGILLTGALTLSGCYDISPDEKITDVYANNLIATTEDDLSLIGQYHVMINKEGKHLGVLFIRYIDENSKTGITCVTYRSYSDRINSNAKTYSSDDKETCVASTLTLK